IRPHSRNPPLSNRDRRRSSIAESLLAPGHMRLFQFRIENHNLRGALVVDPIIWHRARERDLNPPPRRTCVLGSDLLCRKKRLRIQGTDEEEGDPN
ncbi:MAG: hypothetical protein MK136_15175, partial [Pirellulaceae bacterium]|nr:hypothetical protein [Pirellulaceae bacterium]